MARKKSFEYEPAPAKLTDAGTSPKGASAIAFGMIFVLAGSYPLLVGLGVIAARPGSVHCPLLVLAAAGMVFISAGLSVMLRGFGCSDKSLPVRLSSSIVVLTLMTPFVWLVFFSDAPILARVVFGMGLGFFVFIFALCVLLTRFPSLQERFNIRVVPREESMIERRRRR